MKNRSFKALSLVVCALFAVSQVSAKTTEPDTVKYWEMNTQLETISAGYEVEAKDPYGLELAYEIYDKNLLEEKEMTDKELAKYETEDILLTKYMMGESEVGLYPNETIAYHEYEYQAEEYATNEELAQTPNNSYFNFNQSEEMQIAEAPNNSYFNFNQSEEMKIAEAPNNSYFNFNQSEEMKIAEAPNNSYFNFNQPEEMQIAEAPNNSYFNYNSSEEVQLAYKKELEDKNINPIACAADLEE